MSSFSIVLCFALLVPSLPQHQEKALLRTMQEAELVVVAEVVEVYPSPGFWSGVLASVQHVKYKVVEVLKGELNRSEIDVGHYVVHNSLTADKDNPRLSPKLFSAGNRLILSLSRKSGHACKLKKAEGNVEFFCSPNENSGAILAESQLVDRIRSGLKRK